MKIDVGWLVFGPYFPMNGNSSLIPEINPQLGPVSWMPTIVGRPRSSLPGPSWNADLQLTGSLVRPTALEDCELCKCFLFCVCVWGGGRGCFCLLHFCSWQRLCAPPFTTGPIPPFRFRSSSSVRSDRRLSEQRHGKTLLTEERITVITWLICLHLLSIFSRLPRMPVSI